MRRERTPPELLLSNLSSEPDFVELVELFVEELPARVAAIERACNDGNLTQLATLAHQLRGCAGGYGFPSITEAAAVLEQAAKAEAKLDELTTAVQHLSDLCRRARARPADSSP